nr:isoform 2 of nephrocystin-3 [Quercus suber]
MSGAEALAIVGLINASIGITKTILDIGRAVHDAQGLPPRLRVLLEQLPAIEDLLESAREQCDQQVISEARSRTAEPILRQCEQALGELRDIFRKACPENGDHRGRRIWKGTKTVFLGRESQLQKPLDAIQNHLRLLEQQEILTIGDKLAALQQITLALTLDDSSRYTHVGPGNIVANEGGSPTNYVQGGEGNRQINNARVYFERDVARPETPPHPSSNVPFPRDSDFVAREDLIDQVHAILSIPTACAALVGIGGVGKSQLAIEYCYHLREQSRSTWVLWIHASDAVRYETSVRDTADLVRIEGRAEPQANIFALFRDWLRDERKGRWVIVLDNADDVDFLFHRDSHNGLKLYDYLLRCNHGTVLITTRSSRAAARLVEPSQIVAILPMDEKHAVELLEKKLGQQTSRAELTSLAHALEYMPLAIAHAAAYILKRAPRCSVSQYLEQLQSSEQSKIDLLSAESENLRRYHDAKNSIILTWQVSFEYLCRFKKSAADLLSLMSFFHHQEIPDFLLRDADYELMNLESRLRSSAKAPRIWTRLFRRRLLAPFASLRKEGPLTRNGKYEGIDDCPSSSTNQTLKEDIITLRDYHFISVAPAATSFEMHRLVQLAAQTWLKASGQYKRYAERSVHHINVAFPPGDYENWQRCQMLYPHAQSTLDLNMIDRDARLGRSFILLKAATFIKNRGDYEAAEKSNRKALESTEKILGEDHYHTSGSINNLAWVLRLQGKPYAAETMFRRALASQEKVLGREHHDTLACASNLASVLTDQCKYEAAETMLRQTLASQEEILGIEHPDTLGSVHSLGVVLHRQNKYEAAETVYRRAVEGRERVLGKEHPDTLSTVSNLVSALQRQGNYRLAETMTRQTLASQEKALGEEHPATLGTASNLALLLTYLDKDDVAETTYRRVLASQQKVLGQGHSDTLTTIHNLALVLRMQDKDEAAETMYQAVEGRGRVLGKQHPDTLVSMDCLARICQDTGRWQEAEELFETLDQRPK